MITKRGLLKIELLMIIILIIFGCENVSAQSFDIPKRGFVSSKAATNWQDALLSGNGTMGILVPGSIDSEAITINHASLYLPGKTSGTYVKQADSLEHIRELLFAGNYRQASNILAILKKDADYFDTRDPYIPGFNLKISQEHLANERYQRSVNYETGETSVTWKNTAGTFERKAFVSRADSLVVIVIRGTNKISASFSFQSLRATDSKDSLIVSNGFQKIQSGLDGHWLNFQAFYKNTNAYAPFSGYQGLGKVINKGGAIIYEGDHISVTNADEILVLLKLNPVVKFDQGEMSELERFVQSKPDDYAKLLSAHIKKHQPLFNAVSLDLKASLNDRNLPSELLIKKSRETSSVPIAMIEKAFDAGRYNIISSTGTNMPNLIGIWSGQWLSPWVGSFTTNGNVQTAMAFLLQGNTPSLLQAYFNYNDRMMEGYRRNARELFNCRGIHIPAQMTTTPLETDFTPAYPHSYWTGSAGWASRFYFDYYLYTGDKKFLLTKGYPFMKESALFLEDFLKVERDGKYVFIPSYSPENSPGKNSNPPSSINATMDVMITKQLLRNCIRAAIILKTDAEKIKTWRAMLAKMPDYQITHEGALREWLWPGEEENYDHRHASHLYALYDDLPVEFRNDSMRNAAAKTIAMRFDYDKNRGNGFMAFGINHLGWAAAHIGDTMQVNEIINFLAANYWSSGMASYHNMHSLFNMDISGGFPYLVAQCLVYDEPGYLKLLPALPAQWKSGNIKGLRSRGNIVIRDLSWSGKSLTVTLFSATNQSVKIQAPGAIKTVNNKIYHTEVGKNLYQCELKENVDTKIAISFE